MLPASERLRRANVFQRAYAGRKSVSTAYVTLYVLPKINSGAAKKTSFTKKTSARRPLVGFVVAKKVSKNATDRNKAKRRVREAYRRLSREDIVNNGQAAVFANKQNVGQNLDQWYALVWVLHTKVLSATWQEIQKTVVECLEKADAKYGRHQRLSHGNA